MKVKASIRINAEPKQVFDYLADLRNEVDWNTQVTSVKKVSSGKIGRTTKFFAIAKGDFPIGSVITKYERPTRLRISAETMIFDVDDEFTLEKRKNGTKLTQQTELQVHGFLWGLFLIITPVFYLSCYIALRKFKKACEASLYR